MEEAGAAVIRRDRAGFAGAACPPRSPPRPIPPAPEPVILLAISFTPEQLTIGALSLGFLILSLGIHEAAHAWSAWKLGDSTARDLGRMTLNPLPHIDLYMTVLLPGALWYFSGGAMMFGGAKPVPVAYHRLRNPPRDMMLVALAGPLSNFLLAILFVVALKVLLYQIGMGDRTIAVRVMEESARWNVLLAAFNLLPIPPLDGSRVIHYLLPASLRGVFASLDRYGLLVILGLFLFLPHAFSNTVGPVMNSMIEVIDFMTAGHWT